MSILGEDVGLGDPRRLSGWVGRVQLSCLSQASVSSRPFRAAAAVGPGAHARWAFFP